MLRGMQARYFDRVVFTRASVACLDFPMGFAFDPPLRRVARSDCALRMAYHDALSCCKATADTAEPVLSGEGKCCGPHKILDG